MILILLGMQSLFGAYQGGYEGYPPVVSAGGGQFPGYSVNFNQMGYGPSAPPVDMSQPPYGYVPLVFFTQLGLNEQDIQTLNNPATAVKVAAKVQQYSLIRGQLEVLQQMGVDTSKYKLEFNNFNYEAWVAQIQELQRKVKRSPLENPKQPAGWSWQENLTNGFAQIPTYTLNRFWQRITLGFVGFFIPIVWNIPMYSPATCAMTYALSSLVDHSTYVQDRKCACAQHQKSFKCMALYINAFILPFLLWYVLNKASIAY